MTLPSAKEIAKLAAACRKAGIQTFKGGGIEFTLSDSLPAPKTPKKVMAAMQEAASAPVESEELSYDQLLSWSIPSQDDEKTEQ